MRTMHNVGRQRVGNGKKNCIHKIKNSADDFFLCANLREKRRNLALVFITIEHIWG